MKVEIPDSLLRDYEINNETRYTGMNGIKLSRDRETIERSILREALAAAHKAFGQPGNDNDS